MRTPLFLLVFLPLVAFSQAPSAPPDAKLKQKWEQRFRAADQDNSRSLNRAEANAGLPKVLSRHFDEIDLNADAQITPEELWAMQEREAAARAKRRQARVQAGPQR